MNNTIITSHVPVMADEVLEALRLSDNFSDKKGGSSLFVDGTLGAGGHSALMLERHPHLILLGIEQDVSMLARASKRLEKFASRTHLVNANYSDLKIKLSDMPSALKIQLPCSNEGVPFVDRMLLDLGISSDQLTDTTRGLSFQIDAPLDMRLSPYATMSAAEILNNSDERELVKLFITGGVGQSSKALARKVTKARPINTTKQFAAVCSEVHTLYRPKRDSGASKHPATVPFQAMRIIVNKEFEAIKSVLDQALEVLAPKGRLAVISFHSLEDRIVVQEMRRWSRDVKIGHRKLPQTISGAQGSFLTPHALTPSTTELQKNIRARSARMRVFEKNPEKNNR